MKETVKKIRRLEIMLTSKKNLSSKLEIKQEVWATKSIFTKTSLNKGEKITLKNLTFKRPGNGIGVKDLNKILGKKIKKNLPPNFKLSNSLIIK